MKSKTQIGMVLAGWLLGTLGVAVLAYKIKPATGASTKDDEEFVIPSDPVPASDPVSLPTVEKKDEGPAPPEAIAPKTEATQGTPASPKPGTDDTLILTNAVSGGDAMPATARTDPKAASPLPRDPLLDLNARATSDKKLEDVPPFPPAAGGSPTLPGLPPPPPPGSPEMLPAPRADLLRPIPEPPAGPMQMTVAGFPPPPTSSALPSAFVPHALAGHHALGGEPDRPASNGLPPTFVPPSPLLPAPMGATPTTPSMFCKAPADALAPTAPSKTPPAKTTAHPKHLLLTGTHPCKVENQHVTLPASVREQLGEPKTLLVAPGPDGCLWLSTPASLERTAERLERKPNGATQARAFRRIFFSQSERLNVDRDGQVVLPERLTQGTNLRKESIIIGVGDHVELWDAQRWLEYRVRRYLEGIGPVKPLVIQEEEEWYHKSTPASAPNQF